MRRGDIYWADMIPRSGSEQRGRRPVIIVSHDGFNQTPDWRSVIVVPISSSMAQTLRGPTVVPLPRASGGLKKDSVAVCHQVTTLDRAKLTDSLGKLSQELLQMVDAALKAALDLE